MKYFSENYEDFHDSVELNKRICKTLYYGKMPSLDRPSLAMTELAVEVLQDIAPKELGKIDMDWAAAMSRELVMSPCSVMVGMLYAKRLKHKKAKYLHQISSSDLFIVSVMMASKFLYDEGEDGVFNEDWAASVNMDVKDLNELEREFLAAMEWELFVGADEFWNSWLQMERQLARRKTKKSESLTYTEVWLLSTEDEVYCQIKKLLVELCKAVSVCAVAYSVSVMLLAASQFTIYFTISSMMALSTANCQPRLSADSTRVVHMDSRTAFPFHEDTAVPTADCQNELNRCGYSSTHSYTLYSAVNVLFSTLSLLYNNNRPSCRSSHSAENYCKSCVDDQDCVSLHLSLLTGDLLTVDANVIPSNWKATDVSNKSAWNSSKLWTFPQMNATGVTAV